MGAAAEHESMCVIMSQLFIARSHPKTCVKKVRSQSGVVMEVLQLIDSPLAAVVFPGC